MASESQLDIVVNARDEASAKLKTMGENINGSLTKISAVAAGVGLAIGGMAAKSILDFSNVGDAVEKMATRTGLSAESVSALRVAADASGTSIEAIEGSVKKMQLGMIAGKDGATHMDGVLKQLGLTAVDLKGKDMGGQFGLIGNAIAGVADPMKRAQLVMQAFGKSGTDLLPLFEGGKFSMQEWSDEAKKMGVSFDDLSSKKAADLNDRIGELKSTFQGVVLQLGGALAPVIVKVVEAIKPLIEKVSDWIAKNPELTAKIIGMSLAVAGLLAALGPIIAVAGAVSTALAFLATPAGLVVLAILAIVAAIVFVIFNFDTLKKSCVVVWDLIKKVVTDAVTAIVKWVTDLGTKILASVSGMWDSVKSAFKTTLDFLVGLLDIFTMVFFGTKLSTLVKNVKLLWDGMTAAMKLAWQGFSDAVKLIWDGLKLAFEFAMSAIKGIIDKYVTPITDAWNNIWSALKAAFTKKWDEVKKPVQEAFDWLKAKFDAISGFLGGIGNAIKSGVGSITKSGSDILAGRATGGPVTAGTPYLVGERGPELFLPTASGSIVPNHSLAFAGIGGVNVTINVAGMNSMLDVRQVAQTVGDQILSRLKSNLQI